MLVILLIHGTVPFGLVDRIEVLSQGASAIYGSDAVSGVVNIITVKGKDFSEFECLRFRN